MRWADLDLLGHVNNVTYVDYLQEARVDMLRSHGRRAEGEELTEGVVVVRHEVTYLAPLLFRFRPVKIECWVTEIRAATFTMAYEIYHDDLDDPDDADDAGGGRRVYLRASTLLSPYVFANEMPRRLSEEEREALTVYLEPAERVRPARFEVPRTDDGHYAVHVRFSDVDVYGHVNNVKYFEYLQEARIRWMAAVTRGLEVPPIHIVVAQTDVDYRRPILLRQEPYDAVDQPRPPRRPLAHARLGDLRRRRRPGPGPGHHRLLRPRGPAVGRAARAAARAARRGAHSNVLTMNCAAWVT